MNNLKLYSEISLNLELRSDQETIVSSALDIERNRLFFASSSNFIYTAQLSSFQDGKAWSRRSVLSAGGRSVDLDDGDSITCFDYLMEKEALILGTAHGMLLLLHAVDDNSTEAELVGRVEGGVKCVSPSPDGELLAIVSGFGQLLVMTHDWDLLYEVSLLDDQPDAAADVSELDLSSRHVRESSVSWRGDGKYLATLCDLGNSCSLNKRIKVWEQDSGALHAASDSKSFMGAVLEWMPSGAKIAAVYDRRPENECPAIAFYERNGLVRSSFNIGEPMYSTVESLKWNCNSDLLASVVRCHGYDSVKVWFFSNNHWYLKHEIRYSRHDGVKFMWDPIKPLQLISWTLGGQITVYNFIWTTAVTDNSTALVIDGPNVLVTPLSLSVMPPPLYSFSLKFPSAVRDLAFYCKNSKNCMAAYLSDGCLCVAELPELITWEELEGKEFSIEASIPETVFGSFAHLTWLDSQIILAVSHYNSNHSDCFPHGSLSEDGHCGLYLQEIELLCSEGCVPGTVTGSGWQAKSSFKTQFEGQVIGISHNPAKRYSAFVQFDGGKVLEYTSKFGLANAGKHDDVNFPSSCPWMGVIVIDNNGLQRPLLFGLDVIGRLHVGGKLLCSNCRSFSFYSNLADQVISHLILATKQDCLFIVDISDVQRGEVDLKYDNFVYSSNRREEQNMNSINIWERGAHIIGVLHGDDAGVLMQTNRGNLECIYPRKLVLASIVNALMQGRFRDALFMVRRHRIDFNIIVDYCGWQAFLESASEFVKQVNNLSYITEFVCSIRNGNIMETLYKNYIPSTFQKVVKDVQAKELKSFDSSNKVSTVLLAVRKALEGKMPETPARELCILTTLARSDPPSLEEALERIRFIREMELSGSNDPRRISFPSAEEALKHLLWLSDSEAVFEAALGLYDLNLAAMVALNSQRDPKEFLPYLQELEHMPCLIMRYNIDLRLHRFEKALKHIVSAGEAYYSDCMNLLNKNPQLFPLGLQLITDHAKRMQVLKAWGDHLCEEKCFEDAATTYLCCSSLEKALKAYRACGNWSGVLTVAGLLKFGKDEIIQLAHDLCEELQALGKPGEAAKIALEYCGDVNSAINLLASAREWEEALRVAYVHMRDDLVSEVRNASLECAITLISEYEEGLEKVGKYLTRYLAVRQRRLLLAAKLQSEEASMNDLDEDTSSEASSRLSGMSVYTRGTRAGSAASVSPSITSKGRDIRRQKNRGKIRPGSPGEEIALVEHLKGMSLTTGAKCELRSLLVCLVILGSEETAKKLQRMGESFQLSQMAAVKLAEDTMANDTINEQTQTLDHYISRMKREMELSDALSWRSKVLSS